jgi:hypothetical protein
VTDGIGELEIRAIAAMIEECGLRELKCAVEGCDFEFMVVAIEDLMVTCTNYHCVTVHPEVWYKETGLDVELALFGLDETCYTVMGEPASKVFAAVVQASELFVEIVQQNPHAFDRIELP